VSPTGRLTDIVAVEMMEASIGVSLQSALEVLQMPPYRPGAACSTIFKI